MNIEITEKFLEDVKSALAEIDDCQISEHGERYEKLHHNLEIALASIEGL